MSRIEKKGKVTILNREIVKKQEDDLQKTFDYLKSRDFFGFLPVINRDNEMNHYKYVEDLSVDDYQKSEDLIKTICLLHNKTSYNKNVNANTYKSIYNNLIGYVNYLDDYYRQTVESIEYHEFNSPSEILLLDNYYKINEVLAFLRSELDNWHNLTRNKTKQRVCLNHGKMDLSHLIKNDKNYLISFNESNFSSPINDLTYFYKNNWENLDCDNLLSLYLNNCKLNDDELKLLLINITIPPKFEFSNNEYKNTVEMRKFIDYIFKTEELIRPYYSSKNTE